MSKTPLPQQIYRHFKGNLYKIVALAKHSETGEELVIYQALYGNFQVYARPLAMFTERLDTEKYSDAAQEYRFELCTELVGQPAAEQSEAQTGSGQPQEGAFDRKKSAVPEAESREKENGEEQLNIDPLVLEFLDADSHEQRLNILAALHHRITDDMINTMAIAIDQEVDEGDLEERYTELKNCLLMLEKFECNRMR